MLSKKIIQITPDSKIYIFCPYGLKTGGPEALHQLHFKLRSRGFKSFLCSGGTSYAKTAVGAFEKYNPVWVEQVELTSENVLVYPETYTVLLKELYKYDVQHAFWWLSVDNLTTNALALTDILKMDRLVHFVQSDYAGIFLLNQGVHEFFQLTDYIGKDFFERIGNIDLDAKQDTVLFNPKKGFDIVSKLIEMSPSIQWVALENFSETELADLFKKSKVYIDFGNHPGRDRIPREAALFHCVELFSFKGSAQFFLDVPVPAQYKMNLSGTHINYESIITRIHDCFTNYHKLIDDFSYYRRFIKCNEAVFDMEIARIFG